MSFHSLTRILALLLLTLVSGCGREVVETDIQEIKPVSLEDLKNVEPVSIADNDWPWWRGPARNGIAPAQNVPTEWDESTNVIWKTDLPGRGHSSPTIVGNQIFLATALEDKQVQSVVSFNRETGDRLWQTDLHTGNFPASNQMHKKSSHASCTLASDGRRVFVAFLNAGKIHATALDFDGNKLWQTELGGFSPKFGYAPSPVVHEGLVIFAADNEGGGYLAGLNRENGEIVWRTKRPAVSTYASPVVADVGGRSQLLICGGNTIKGYDPLRGEELWSVDGTAEGTVGTMVWDNDLVVASGGYPQKETVCVNAATGDVVWRSRDHLYVPSLLAHAGYVYGVNDDGIAICWNIADGKQRWKSRLGGSFSSSPVLAGENIFINDENGTTSVFKANPEKFELVSKNQLGNQFFASPAIVGNRIYLRGAFGDGSSRQEVLYCIGFGT
ncbi:MAG TPA: PQQ-binding-like beta-propeller repeat protein [Planctomycetaceae bacterium]|nr:PQQ-binding-like beta-propeller repeat protein [Planctomycetaceae bacterium]